MRTAIIIHGTYGNPDENWFPWLKTELEKIGYQVYAPIFPTPENQNLEAWLKVIGDLHNNIGAKTIFIGHSVGASFILSILESLDLPVRAAFFSFRFFGFIG
jgi:predicted alpha/beta hydrolase family esterase